VPRASGSFSDVRVEGGAKLRRELRAAAGDLDDLKDANAAAADYVAGIARSRAPVRTGALRATVRGNRAAGRATVSSGSATVLYAGPIHWGWPTRGVTKTKGKNGKRLRGGPIRPNRFIWDTAQEYRDEWLPAYEQNVQSILDRIDGAYRAAGGN
jgi:hypothetical protein